MEKQAFGNKNNSEKSKAQIIFESLSKGEINQETANKLTALLLADTLSDHPVRPYPIRGQSLEQYVRDRLQTSIPREPVLAKKNGEWLQAIAQINTNNQADYDLLKWAESICREIMAVDQVKRIRAHMMRFARNQEKLNVQEIKNARDVQMLDGQEKLRN